MTLYVAAVVVLWAAAIIWLVAMARNTTQRHLAVGLVALAVACTLELDPVATLVQDIPGASPNIAHMVKHLAVVLAAGAIWAVVRALGPSGKADRLAWRALVLTGAACTMLVLFVLAPVHDVPVSGLTAAAAGEPILLVYWTVYAAVIGTACLGIVGVALRSLRTFPAGALRIGMCWMGAGALIGLAYCAHKLAFLAIASVELDGYDAPVMDRVQSMLLALTVLAFVIGLMIPMAPRLPLARHLIAYANHRRLYPVWRAYLQSEPDIELGDTGRAFDVELRLYRRMVEIRDGMLAVRPYADPDARSLVLSEIQRSHHEDPNLLGEVVWLELGRRAKLRGGPIQPMGDASIALTGGDTIADERRVLVRIARSWSTIQAIADRIDNAATSGTSR